MLRNVTSNLLSILSDSCLKYTSKHPQIPHLPPPSNIGRVPTLLQFAKPRERERKLNGISKSILLLVRLRLLSWGGGGGYPLFSLPNQQRWHAKWKLSRNAYATHSRLCTFCVNSQAPSVLIDKISASELSRKLILRVRCWLGFPPPSSHFLSGSVRIYACPC